MFPSAVINSAFLWIVKNQSIFISPAGLHSGHVQRNVHSWVPNFLQPFEYTTFYYNRNLKPDTAVCWPVFLIHYTPTKLPQYRNNNCPTYSLALVLRSRWLLIKTLILNAYIRGAAVEDCVLRPESSGLRSALFVLNRSRDSLQQWHKSQLPPQRRKI